MFDAGNVPSLERLQDRRALAKSLRAGGRSLHICVNYCRGFQTNAPRAEPETDEAENDVGR